MNISATVLVPTHEHGRLLSYAVASALAQTVSDIEVLIVGDGPTEETKEAALDLVKADRRVTFYENPKGPRHGELHRHTALKMARGRIVCYLSDDDLWLPDHVAEMDSLLRNFDFARALAVSVDASQRLHIFGGNMSSRVWYNFIAKGRGNFIGLSDGAHTLDLYRRLPHGWRTTPQGTPTDLYMWRQLLAMPGCRAAGGSRPTVVRFPSPYRTGHTLEERRAEMAGWAERLRDPGRRAWFLNEVESLMTAPQARVKLAARTTLLGIPIIGPPTERVARAALTAYRRRRAT